MHLFVFLRLLLVACSDWFMASFASVVIGELPVTCQPNCKARNSPLTSGFEVA